MKFKRTYLAAAMALLSGTAVAGDAYLNIQLDGRPLQGVDVYLDGDELGETGPTGVVLSEVDGGDHTFLLARDEQAISQIEFTVADDEDVVVNVLLSSDADKPAVEIKTYNENEAGELGLIGGVITDQLGNPVVGAEISVIDEGITATTDSSGVYEINIQRGSYDVSIDHPDYAITQISDLRVLPGLGASASVKLKQRVVVQGAAQAPVIQAPSEIEEVVTFGTWNPVDTAAGMERFSTTVIDAIDAVQLERFGDASAAGALTRIVGVSVNDGKYANVRGLDGRYISTSLNGLLLPSTDPLRRDVQLDLFPASILGGIEIQKTFSADVLGSTTGGHVKMMTKGLPDERGGKISGSLGYNTDVTGEDFLTFENSNSDHFTYDSGLRDLPGSVESQFIPFGNGTGLTDLQQAQLAASLQDDWDPEQNSAAPNFSLSASFGDLIGLDNGDFGYYAAIDYGQEYTSRVDAEVDAVFRRGTYTQHTHNTSLSAYLVTGYEFRESDEILSKTIYLRDSAARVRTEDVFNQEEENNEDTFVLDWQERGLISQQFTGSHGFDVASGSQLDWRVGFSRTTHYQPDRRQYKFLNGILPITSEVERRWSDLEEDSLDFSVDYSVNFDFGDYVTSELLAGILLSDKSREVKLSRLGYALGPENTITSSDVTLGTSLEGVFSYENIADGQFVLDNRVTDTEPYEADEELFAYYLATNTDIGDQWTVSVGVRQEEFTQDLRYPFDPAQNDDAGQPDSDELLPSLSVTYRPTEDWQFRFGASQTVSYPGLIEKSASRFFDEENRQVLGNPNLEVSTIDSLDFRAEYYFSDEESISLAYFSKDIDSPIEVSIPNLSGSQADNAITFRNSEEATLTGLELDAYINVIDSTDYLGFLSGNISYIESEVTLAGESLRLEGPSKQGRELQGQSPWLANLQFGLDHFETEQKFTVLLNYFDDRIFVVSLGDAIPVVVESGRLLVNLNYEKRLNEATTIKAKINNIFNEPVERTQNGQVIETFKTGPTVSVSASYEF